jgi:hypothetical protein
VKYSYSTLTKQIRSAVGSYYASLARRLEEQYPSPTERMAHLVDLQVAKKTEYSLIGDFEALLSKFFPDISPDSRTEELESP